MVIKEWRCQFFYSACSWGWYHLKRNFLEIQRYLEVSHVKYNLFLLLRKYGMHTAKPFLYFFFFRPHQSLYDCQPLNFWIHVSVPLPAGGGREIILLLWDCWVRSPPPWPHFPSWDFEACQTLNPKGLLDLKPRLFPDKEDWWNLSMSVSVLEEFSNSSLR